MDKYIGLWGYLYIYLGHMVIDEMILIWDWARCFLVSHIKCVYHSKPHKHTQVGCFLVSHIECVCHMKGPFGKDYRLYNLNYFIQSTIWITKLNLHNCNLIWQLIESIFGLWLVIWVIKWEIRTKKWKIKFERESEYRK